MIADDFILNGIIIADGYPFAFCCPSNISITFSPGAEQQPEWCEMVERALTRYYDRYPRGHSAHEFSRSRT